MSSRFVLSTPPTRRSACVFSGRPTNLIITWDWSILRCRIVSQVEEHFIHVAPAPTFGRIITLDDQVMCSMIVTGCMAAWRFITTTNMSASPADSEMNPFATGFQTFLAAARTRSNFPDGAQMRAAFTHNQSALLVRVKNVILVFHIRMARETAVDGTSRVWLERVGRGLIVKHRVSPSLGIRESLAVLFDQEDVLQGVRHVH